MVDDQGEPAPGNTLPRLRTYTQLRLSEKNHMGGAHRFADGRLEALVAPWLCTQ